MKKEILNRIKQLGGNVANVKGVSLQEDFISKAGRYTLAVCRRYRTD